MAATATASDPSPRARTGPGRAAVRAHARAASHAQAALQARPGGRPGAGRGQASPAPESAPTQAPPQPAVPPSPGGKRRRRLLAAAAAGLAAALLAVIALLATLVASGPAPARSPAAAPTPSASASLPVPAIYQKVAPSVVVIRAGDALGSGVIVADNGTILTANHVIAGAKSITVTFSDGTASPATVTSANPRQDVALLAPARLPATVVPASLGGTATAGAPVEAIGNPLGLDYSVSAGVISGLGRSAKTSSESLTGLIQFDASVNPGSSGGPLLDSRGLVIGIVVAIADPGDDDAFAGIGFAVPIGSALGGGNGTGVPGPRI